MSSSGLKQKALGAILGVIALYALAVGLWFLTVESAWKKASKAYKKAQTTYREECKLISRKAELQEKYEAEKSNMPSFAVGKETDTTWRRKVDELAEKHHIVISSADAGKEFQVGDVYELPIEVKSWEGSLESLVKFLHELENSDVGMFDVKSISMRPSAKKGYLKGSLSLTCAYMRES